MVSASCLRPGFQIVKSSYSGFTNSVGGCNMPAATVWLVPCSMRMKEPVRRFVRVAVEDDRLGCAQSNFADVVHGQFSGRLGIERVNIDAAFEAGDDGLHRLRGVLEEIFSARLQRPRIHPAHAAAQFGGHAWPILRDR